MYVCDAGSTYNRFESDFNKWNYTLTCLENNVFTEEPTVPWPTCVDSEYYTKKIILIYTICFVVTQCPNPTSSETPEIALTNTISNDINYNSQIR